MNKIHLLLIVVCLSIFLSACNNSDATSSNTVTAYNGKDGMNGKDGANGKDGKNGKDGADGKEAQSIRFLDTSNKYAFVGDQFTRTVGGALGTGTITYQSDNPDIAKVDPHTGAVEILSAGTTLIRAHISDDNHYSAANDFYYLNAAPKTVAFNAHIGSKDTLLDFSTDSKGLQFNRSTNAKCNLDNFNVCQNARLDTINSSSIVDTATNYNQSSTYWLKHGNLLSRGTVVSPKRFSNRSSHQAVTFNDGSGEKLWIIGGNDFSLKNDTWSSSDGSNWMKHTNHAAFSPRTAHQVVRFNDGTGDKLWLIGGYDGNLKNDIWTSRDGISWTQLTANAAFSARKNHQVVAYNDGTGNKLWLIGGYDGSKKNDIWSSSDGINWTQETANTAFSPREKHQAVSFNDGSGEKLWLIGGNDGSAKNDVWSSSDGIIWTQQTANAAFSGRASHQVITFNDGTGDRLWLIGGDDFSLKNDVWSSGDGINWEQQSNHAEFSARAFHQVLAYNDGSGNKLWLIAGTDGSMTNDVWSSSNGINWKAHRAGPEFSARSAHQAVTFDNGSGNKLWLIGGNSGKRANDVWSSTDGINWTQETANAAFSARRHHQVVTFNDGSGNKLWLIGGNDGENKNDVWSSTDGVNWTQQTANAAFSARSAHQLIAFNDGSGNKLWLIGGNDGENKNDIWSSSDGINWTQQTASAAFSARNHFQVVRFNDGGREKLWLIGGRDTAFRNDVWSSTDGINWVQQTAHATFTPRRHHQVVTFDDGSGKKLWLIGGDDGTYKNDVWSSSNGIDWVQKTAKTAFSKRFSHQVVNYNDGSGEKLWLIGGDDIFLNNEVWSSSDGIDWRFGTHSVIKFN